MAIKPPYDLPNMVLSKTSLQIAEKDHYLLIKGASFCCALFLGEGFDRDQTGVVKNLSDSLVSLFFVGIGNSGRGIGDAFDCGLAILHQFCLKLSHQSRQLLLQVIELGPVIVKAVDLAYFENVGVEGTFINDIFRLD